MEADSSTGRETGICDESVNYFLEVQYSLASPSGGGAPQGQRGLLTEKYVRDHMKNTYIVKNHRLVDTAKDLRRNMTQQERRLWHTFLKQYPVRIYRQRIINNYIVDFYCHQARLVIELDGSQHYTDEGIIHDNERTEVLQRYGISVLRFSNLDVEKNFRGVCEMIDRVIRERIDTLS